MASVSNNTQRNCKVRETDIGDGFKVTVYPALMDLDLESNNTICAVKEIYTKFTTDKFIDQRVRLGKETLVGNLVLDVVNIVERQIDYVRKGKEEMVKELQAKFLEVSKILDTQVMRLYPNDQRNQDFVQKRATDTVFKYNTKAEELRNGECDKLKKLLFCKVLKKSTPSDEPENNPFASSSGRNSPHSSSSGEPAMVRFKSHPKTTLNNGILDDSTTIKAGPSNPSNVPAGPTPTANQPPAPAELTDDEFKAVVANTKLSDPEPVPVEGLSGFSYVRQLSPVSPDQIAISADKSTGSLTFQDNTFRVDSVVERGDNGTMGVTRPALDRDSGRVDGTHAQGRPTRVCRQG